MARILLASVYRIRRRLIVATRKPKPDVNESAAKAVREVTDSEPVRGADLIRDPKLRAEFIKVMNKASAKPKKT
jgi:hypothetical protein